MLIYEMPSYPYIDSDYQDTTVSQPSYLHNRAFYTSKYRFYIEIGPMCTHDINVIYYQVNELSVILG